MARIAFLPLNESGHINPTFKLSRQLRARGHDVCYLAFADMEARVRAQGCDFIPIFEHLYPKGYVDAARALFASESPDHEKRAVALELDRRWKAYNLEVLYSADFEARLHEHDVAIVDTAYAQPALVARRAGIPAVILCITFPLRVDMAVPALFVPTIPTGWWSRFKTRAFWTFFTMARAISTREPVQEQLREFSRRYPKLGGLYDFRTHLQFGPNVKLTTLIAACAELDFPRTSTEGLHYIGPCVDLDRQEPPLPPELDKEGPPLIYCSLGSNASRTAQHRPFFQALLDAVARKPEWWLMLTVGTEFTIADLRIPPNATVVASAPQLAALRRAALMITHGGLNSVKESICLGVPMIVFPTGWDQPGNGARIVHHGLGVMGDLDQATPQRISSMIDMVSGDPGYRARVRAMQSVFLAANESNQATVLIERLLAEGVPGTSVA